MFRLIGKTISSTLQVVSNIRSGANFFKCSLSNGAHMCTSTLVPISLHVSWNIKAYPGARLNFRAIWKQCWIFPLKKERKCHSIWMKSKFSSKRLPRRIKSRVDYFFWQRNCSCRENNDCSASFTKLGGSARVSRFDFTAASVPSKKIGRIMSFTAEACCPR